MKYIFALFALILLFSSCKKENLTGSASSTQAGYFPSQPGTYWIYEWYAIDSNNVETSLGIVDSVFISGDTTINNNIYTIYNDGLGGPSFESYRRDSSGYIVEPSGNILYSYVNFSDTLNSYSEPGYWDVYSYMLKLPTTVSVPVGIFSAIKYESFYSDPTGNSVTNCGDLSFTTGTFYSSAIGEVKQRTGFIGDVKVKCEFRERRLVSYYIP